MSNVSPLPVQPGGTGAAARFSSDTVSYTGAGVGRAVGGLSIRTRLFGLAACVAILGAIAVTVATTGLIGQKGKVQSVDTTFKTFKTERNAYEGWLTADDQMNMYAALAILDDPSQRSLLSATWQQLVAGHAQAVSSLNALVATAGDSSVRSAAQSTLTDLNSYFAYTMRMHALVQAGQLRQAVKEITVSNATISNKTQADFNSMGAVLTAQAAKINSQAMSAASSSIQLVIIVAVIAVLLALVVTYLLAR
ncbi:MAG: hypothetical protein ACYCXW_23210, partial [Solirubrobacteraceae bacterium]